MATGVSKTIDDICLRYCDSESPEQISERLNGALTPEEVAAHTKRLLRSPDWINDQEQQQLVDIRLRRILAQLEEQVLTIDNANTQLRLLKEIGARLDRRIAARQIDLDKWHGNMGRLMARAYDIALDYIRGAFTREIDPERWDKTAEDALRYAWRELERHQAKEIES